MRGLRMKKKKDLSGKKNKKIGRLSASGLRLPLLTMLVYRTPHRNV